MTVSPLSSAGPARQRGRLITFEGIHAAGKTTQQRLLVAALREGGRQVCSTSGPQATRIGEAVHELLRLIEPTEPATRRADALLRAADVAQHVDQIIRPALEQGHDVVMDGFTATRVAYSNATHRKRVDVAQLLDWATGHLQPDLTIVLDLDPAVAHRRRYGRVSGGYLAADTKVQQDLLGYARHRADVHLVLAAYRPEPVLADAVLDRIERLMATLWAQNR